MNKLYAKFKDIEKSAAAKRQNISPLAFTLSSGPAIPLQDAVEGEYTYKVQEFQREARATIGNMVFGDQMPGRVFPGAFLWAVPLVQDGRLESVASMKRSKPLVITVDGAVMKAGKPTSYEFDGSEAGYAKVLAQVGQNISSSQARLTLTTSSWQNAEAALLEVGLTASGWGASIAANLKTNRENKRSSFLISISQTYFTLTCEPQPGESHFSEQMFSKNAELAEKMVELMSAKGEIGTVHRVSYGRRILLSITSSASAEELAIACKAGYKSAGGSISGSLTMEQRKTLSMAQAHLMVLGGKTDAFLGDNLNLPADAMLEKLSKYLGDTINMDDATSAAIMGFGVEYTYDGADAIKLESVKFSEQVRPSRTLKGGLVEIDYPFSFNKYNKATVSVDKGDSEIDSDDTTHSIVEYRLTPAPYRDKLLFQVTLRALEGTKSGGYGDTQTRLKSREIIIWPGNGTQQIAQINGQTGPLTGQRKSIHRGKSLFKPQEIEDFEVLRNVKVIIDAPGDSDASALNITGNVVCTIKLKDGPVEVL